MYDYFEVCVNLLTPTLKCSILLGSELVRNKPPSHVNNFEHDFSNTVVKHHVCDTGHYSQELLFCHALMLSVTIALNPTSTTCPASRIVGPCLFVKYCGCQLICVNFIRHLHVSTRAAKSISGYRHSIHPEYVHLISWTSL